MITAKQQQAIKDFEADFQRACEKYNINAAFVLVKQNDEKGSLLMIGGCSQLSDYVEGCLALHSVEAQGARQ